MPQIVDIARRLALAAPEATLACPLCGIALKAANLERHLTKIHPGESDAGTSWRGRGLKGGRLEWNDGGLHWRSRTGLRRRTVERVRSVAAGSTLSSRSEWTSVTNAPNDGGPAVRTRSGAYVQVRGDGRPITVRCRSGGTARKAWVGWEPGSRVTTWQVTINADAFAALLFLLADAGAIQPKPT